ncbi:hypothetical protein ACFQH9_06565 [Pseudonocardia lutea]|uniref:Uncharacterized protein n=1 Tax=Pseudonocardia lutea TaxID=2172015 RepID=A0ABW1I2U3_9PSEU
MDLLQRRLRRRQASGQRLDDRSAVPNLQHQPVLVAKQQGGVRAKRENRARASASRPRRVTTRAR